MWNLENRTSLLDNPNNMNLSLFLWTVHESIRNDTHTTSKHTMGSRLGQIGRLVGWFAAPKWGLGIGEWEMVNGLQGEPNEGSIWCLPLPEHTAVDMFPGTCNCTCTPAPMDAYIDSIWFRLVSASSSALIVWLWWGSGSGYGSICLNGRDTET